MEDPRTQLPTQPFSEEEEGSVTDFGAPSFLAGYTYGRQQDRNYELQISATRPHFGFRHATCLTLFSMLPIMMAAKQCSPVFWWWSELSHLPVHKQSRWYS